MRLSELCLIALLLCGHAGALNRCCSVSAHLLLWNLTCSDGANVTLRCQQGFFFFDRRDEPEKFLTDANGSLTLDDEYAADGFCISPAADNSSASRTIALVCFHSAKWTVEHIFDWTFVTLMTISIPFLFATLLIYLLIPVLRDLNGKCIIGYVASLAISYATVISIHVATEIAWVICSIRGAILYYSTLSTFAWLNLVTFNLWRSVRNKVYRISDCKLFYIYIAWSVGIPLLACLIAILLDFIPGTHFTGHFTAFNCWFIDSLGFWVLFYTPMTVLVFLNILMFVHCCCVLWRGYRDPTQSRIRILRLKCKLTLRLFLISGVPWIFEIISFSLQKVDSLKYLWFVIDCLNSTQGVTTFVILVVCSKRVLRAIQQHHLFGIKWPESWGELNADSCVPSEMDKVALEQIQHP